MIPSTPWIRWGDTSTKRHFPCKGKWPASHQTRYFCKPVYHRMWYFCYNNYYTCYHTCCVYNDNNYYTCYHTCCMYNDNNYYTCYHTCCMYNDNNNDDFMPHHKVAGHLWPKHTTYTKHNTCKKKTYTIKFTKHQSPWDTESKGDRKGRDA